MRHNSRVLRAFKLEPRICRYYIILHSTLATIGVPAG